MILDDIGAPVVLAPMAGGPSTPELTAAVTEAGGFGILAAGYLSAGTLAQRIAQTRQLTSARFGVNLFAPGKPTPVEQIAPYLDELAATGAEVGEPRFDDDDWSAKLDLLVADPVAVVSFTFCCPSPTEIERLHAVGSEVWVTVTSTIEAQVAVTARADVLIAQGAEAGGHRATFLSRPGDDFTDPIGLIALMQLLRGTVFPVPLVASGGITTGAGLAAALAAGAAAAQLGSVFMRCPEAGTSAVVRDALTRGRPTALTRAFTGRWARGIRNRFLDEHTATAPAAYPEIHYATSPLRQAARESGDGEAVNLWAGQSYQLAKDRPAAEVVQRLVKGCRVSLEAAAKRISPP